MKSHQHFCRCRWNSIETKKRIDEGKSRALELGIDYVSISSAHTHKWKIEKRMAKKSKKNEKYLAFIRFKPYSITLLSIDVRTCNRIKCIRVFAGGCECRDKEKATSTKSARIIKGTHIRLEADWRNLCIEECDSTAWIRTIELNVADTYTHTHTRP